MTRLFNISASVFAFILLFMVVNVTPVKAGTIQITNNTYNDGNPQINERKVIWEGFDGSDNEIFLYDFDNDLTSKITNNENFENEPQINDGKIVWQGGDGETDEIYLYDISTGLTTQITNNNSSDFTPQTSAGKVVWWGFDGSDNEIFLYDITSGTTTQITNNNFNDARPRIDGGKIVWRGGINIFLYDISAGITTQITNDGYLHSSPKISDGKVVWVRYDGHDDDVFLYDITTGSTTQVTNNNPDDESVQIDNGKIVWRTSGSGIFLYDIASGATTQLTNVNNADPQIDSGKIVWRGGDGTTDEIFMYDIASGEITQLTNNSFNDTLPQVDAGMVVWFSNSGNTSENEIFLWDESIPTNNLPTAEANGPYNAAEGSSVALSGSGTDPDTDPLTYTWDLDNNGTFETSGQNPTFSAATKDGPSTQTVVLKVCDDDNACDTDSATVNITNVAPSVGAITASVNPIMVNESTTTTASFTDPGVPDTHTASWNWGDGTTSNGTITNGTVSDSHTYTATGVYEITLTVTDDNSGVGTSVFQYLSVYNPTPQGHFSGARKYNSPAGAYIQNTSLTGEAAFGISARYDGATAVGDIELNFDAANFNFVSTGVQTFVTDNGKATLTGTGSANGTSGYTFIVTGIDENPPAKGLVRFQIKNSSGTVVYDTQPGAGGTANPTTSVTAGQIIVN